MYMCVEGKFMHATYTQAPHGHCCLPAPSVVFLHGGTVVGPFLGGFVCVFVHEATELVVWHIQSVGVVWGTCQSWCSLYLRLVVLAACPYLLWRGTGDDGSREAGITEALQFA